ncbi:hypothetical protein K4F52_000361 [Lecanicillium sp. MT-2017a]|nr:hypothetical protein K4F52_000361 [Lecanicillium sp. MT-2017a]
MRFSIASVFVAAIAGTAMAAPVQKRGALLGQLSNVVSQVEGGVGVESLEKELDGALGGAVKKVESALGGVPLADKLMGMVDSGLPPSVVQAIGQAIDLADSGVAIQTVDAYLKGATDGALTSLGGALDITDIEKTLQI